MTDRVRNRDMLNLWATVFMGQYTPDPEDHKAARKVMGELAFTEGKEGPTRITEVWTRPVEKDPLYVIGETICRQWAVPMTQYGLIALIQGCHNPDDVRMLVAAVYKKFVQLKPPKDQLLDAISVSMILQDGTPKRSHLTFMWRVQVIGKEGVRPVQNLLDILKPEDFKTA